MARESDDELHVLRLRAYGPGADIHSDSIALERLRELEGARRRREQPLVYDDPEVLPEPVERDVTVDVETEPLGRDRFAPLSGARRSTVLLILGVVFAGMILAVSPGLVDRVQSPPLQAGADQVARLSLELGFDVPRVITGTVDRDNNGSQGFQVFHGLRVVKPDYASLSGSADACLILYVDADISEPEVTSFPGPSFFGCSAGGFPATVQFEMTEKGLPAELTSAFPETPALQFVYDRTRDEVVVFAQRADGSG